jgi:hypothetical protein
MTSPGDESTQQVISAWIEDNTFPPPKNLPEKLQVILTGKKLPRTDPTAPRDLAIHCAFGIFELQGAFDGKDKSFFKNGSLFIATPGYPRFQVAGGFSGDVRKGIKIAPINAGKFANGKVEIYVESADKKTVSIGWELDVQFAGKLDDKTYFFDLDKTKPLDDQDSEITDSDADTLQKLSAYYSGDVDNLWFINPYDVLPTESQLSLLSGKSPDEARAIATAEFNRSLKLIEAYVKDHYDARTGNFVIQTYYPEEVTGITGNVKASNEETISVTFLKVFEVVGSIGKDVKRSVSCSLYVKIPILGRVKISSLTGSLASGGAQVKATINVRVAKGSASLFLKGKDLYLGIAIKVQFIGEINQREVKLLTLPF